MRFCSLAAQDQGLDPIGYSTFARRFFALENPLPWPKRVWFSPEHAPASIPKLFEHLATLSDEERAALSTRPLMVAPERSYTPAGYRRFFILEQPTGAFADYRRHEYLVPEHALSDLIWAALIATEALADFDDYRVHAPYRDFLICTQGAVDAACGKFGYRLYQRAKEMAQNYPDVRVWRAAHFGGHVFAPTLLELPSARCWAHLGEAQLDALFSRRCDIRVLDGHYRGWAGLDGPFLQVAEKELMLRRGWAHLGEKKRGCTLKQEDGDEPSWAEVHLEVGANTYHARVECSHTLTVFPKSGSEETYPYPQYRVVSLERRPA